MWQRRCTKIPFSNKPSTIVLVQSWMWKSGFVITRQQCISITMFFWLKFIQKGLAPRRGGKSRTRASWEGCCIRSRIGGGSKADTLRIEDFISLRLSEFTRFCHDLQLRVTASYWMLNTNDASHVIPRFRSRLGSWNLELALEHNLVTIIPSSLSLYS